MGTKGAPGPGREGILESLLEGRSLHTSGHGEPEGGSHMDPSEGACGSRSLRFRMCGILIPGTRIDPPDPQQYIPVVSVAHTF